MNDNFTTLIINWRIKNIPDNIVEIFYYYPKSLLQRAFRGWADRDIWSLDSHLLIILPQMIEHLKKHSHGYPGVDEASTPEKWNNILDQMIEGFEAGKKVLDDDYVDQIQPKWFENGEKLTSETLQKSMEENLKDQDLFHERMKLFDRWFFSLWD